MKVHEILRKIRRDRDLTQQNIADALDIDVTTYNRWEKNGNIIQVEQLEKIAKYFKMSIQELLSYPDESEPNPNQVMESFPTYQKRRTLTLSIELDGEKSTVDYWIDKIKKVNAALA
jgi:transcriptional regulator with XRE-family HTH domain